MTGVRPARPGTGPAPEELAEIRAIVRRVVGSRVRDRHLAEDLVQDVLAKVLASWDRIDPATFVGEVVMKSEMTPFLAAVAAKGCRYQVGTDMLFEQIPAYLDFFGFGKPPVQELRDHATIRY